MWFENSLKNEFFKKLITVSGILCFVNRESWMNYWAMGSYHYFVTIIFVHIFLSGQVTIFYSEALSIKQV